MLAMYTIPKDLISAWDKMKRDLVSDIERAEKNETGGLQANLKQAKAEAIKLLGEFDQGLKTKMKVAASAKNDADAKKAALAVLTVADEYRNRLKKVTGQWPASIKPVAQRVDALLVKISQHALASSKARAPITFTKELDDLERLWQNGTTRAIGQIPKDQKAAADGLRKLLDLQVWTAGLKPPLTSAKTARTEADLLKSLLKLKESITTYIKLVEKWPTTPKPPANAAELKVRTAAALYIENVLDEMRDETGKLSNKLHDAIMK
jgi:hypothetical protein